MQEDDRRRTVSSTEPGGVTLGRPATAPVRGWSGAWLPLSLPAAAVGLWVLGAIVCLGRLVLSVMEAHRLERRAAEIVDPAWRRVADDICQTLGITRSVRLLRADRPLIPLTWGWRRPIVLVPHESDQWTAERRLVVLRHELAHISRGDALTQRVAQVAASVYWFHPLAWYAAHRLRVEQERACDDTVVGLGTKPSDYADHLLQVATGSGRHAVVGSAGVAMARCSQLEGRLVSILAPGTPRTATRTVAVVVGAMATGLAVAVSAVTPDSRRAPVSVEATVATEVELQTAGPDLLFQQPVALQAPQTDHERQMPRSGSRRNDSRGSASSVNSRRIS